MESLAETSALKEQGDYRSANCLFLPQSPRPLRPFQEVMGAQTFRMLLYFHISGDTFLTHVVFVAILDELWLFWMGFPSDAPTVAKTCTLGCVETLKKCGSVTFKVLSKINDSV